MISGQFPVNPLTIRYINEQLTAEGHRPDGTVQPLTVLDLEELEDCQALLQRKGRTLPQLAGRLVALDLPRRRLPQLPCPRDRRPGTRTTERRPCR